MTACHAHGMTLYYRASCGNPVYYDVEKTAYYDPEQSGRYDVIDADKIQ